MQLTVIGMQLTATDSYASSSCLNQASVRLGAALDSPCDLDGRNPGSEDIWPKSSQRVERFEPIDF